MKATRKRVRILMLAAIVASMPVGVDLAMSLELSPDTAVAGTPLPMAKITPVAMPSTTALSDLPDAAKLFGLGTLLIALSAVARRAV